MMKTRIALLGLVAVCIFGCSSAADTGDKPEGRQAAAKTPKSASQLPENMPPEAKASAAAAIGQAQAASEQNGNAARIHAMQMMNQQKGGH